LGSLGRLGHAYTCPASTPDCSGSSTWITDLGFVYTSRGELSDVWEFTPHSNGAYYHVNATYWANGLINSLNSGLTGLPTWTYNPEGEGRVTTVIASSGQNPVPTGTPVSYNTWGLPNGVSFGSGDSNTFVYDDSASGRLTQYQASVNGSLMTGVLTWNANGSLRQLAITDALNANNAQTCTHQHDDLARIAAVNCGTGKWNQAFTYGSNGFGNVNWTGTGLGTSFTQAYDTTYNTNHFQGTGISYDANGNLLTDVVHTYSWDADGKLHQMDSTIMTYDALGRRVEEANGLAYNQILYGPGGSKLATINGLTQCASSFYLPLPGGAAAFYDCTGLKRYRHADWLGSSRLSSTASRTLNYDGAYSPMGESYSETGTTDRNFTGQNQELANDLYAFQYREYQPIHGRWISPDPAGLGAVNPANPQSLNRYAYVNGSPLNSLDPLGLMCIAYSAGPQTCGWQQAAGWLVGQGGWNPGSGMGVPPHGGLSNASSEVITSAAAADEGRYVAYVRAAYIASVFQEYPILQSIYLGFGNIGVITSTTITFAGEVDDWKQQMALLSAEGLIASVNKAADAAEHNSNTGVGTGPTRAKQGDLTPDRLAMITGSVENMPNIGAPVHYPPAVCAALPWVGGGLSAASAAAGLVYWPVGAGIMVVGGAGCY
jgi:RHS repeat-associated protein